MRKLKTAEDMYWHIRHHLLTQGKMAMTSKWTSTYLAKDGCRCSSGCLIPTSWENSIQTAADLDIGWIGYTVPEEISDAPEIEDFFAKCQDGEIQINAADGGDLEMNVQMVYYHELSLIEKNVQLLCDLEKVHENFHVKDWEKELDRIAIQYDLCDVIISPRATATLPEKNATLEEIVK